MPASSWFLIISSENDYELSTTAFPGFWDHPIPRFAKNAVDEAKRVVIEGEQKQNFTVTAHRRLFHYLCVATQREVFKTASKITAIFPPGEAAQ